MRRILQLFLLATSVLAIAACSATTAEAPSDSPTTAASITASPPVQPSSSVTPSATPPTTTSPTVSETPVGSTPGSEEAADDGSKGPDLGAVIVSIGAIALLALIVFLLGYVFWWAWKNVTNFRTTIHEKEWVIQPASDLEKSTRALEIFEMRLDRLTGGLERLTESLEARREHLDLLASSIAEKDAEMKSATLGVEHHARRKAIRSLAVLAEILEADRRVTVAPDQTLRGVKAELEQVLSEYGVVTFEPKPGEQLPRRGTSEKSTKTIPAPRADLAGTVVSVQAPAFIYVGPNGAEDTLVPMRVTVYALVNEQVKQ